MTRVVNDVRLESRAVRAGLEPRPRPYYRAAGIGVHLGYRKSPSGGVWVVRRYIGGKYIARTIAAADDHYPADGHHIMNFEQVCRRAQQAIGTGAPSLTFVTPLPKPAFRVSNEKRAAGRQVLVDAIRASAPDITPTCGDVIVHILAEVSRSHTVADVDNLLKPTLDAMAGLVYQNDTQVTECLIRKMNGPAPGRLTIKVWT